MRIATIHIGQETNDFNPLPTTIDDFKAFGILEGQEIIEKMAGKGQVGGCVDAMAASGMNVEWVPIISGWAMAGGRIDTGAPGAAGGCASDSRARQGRSPMADRARWHADFFSRLAFAASTAQFAGLAAGDRCCPG